MSRVQGYRITGRFTVACKNVEACGNDTTQKYARAHQGLCKMCYEGYEGGTEVRTGRVASREEQRARYIDCGPQAWDDRN